MGTPTSERLGSLAGIALAPWTGAISALRRARMFHPRGTVLIAEVRSCASGSPWTAIAERLEGPALVRLSSAWWKRRELPDVLGCAIRFTRTPELAPAVHGDDQDLLLATIRRPWTLPFAPLSTKQHDYFANRYYGVSPFRTPDTDRIELRVSPERPLTDGRTREQRLARGLARGLAVLTLEARPYRHVTDLRRHRTFHPVVRITLRRPCDVDQEALRFDPFQAGRGIEPSGFVQALRIATYASSQWARPVHA